MKRKIFTFLLCGLFGSILMAQTVKPDGVIVKATTKPVIDGVIDAVWATANAYNVDLPFKLEVPTLGDAGTTYWKGLWDDDGMYILVVANDDAWDPWFLLSTGNTYDFDMVELYFDTNANLADGLGGQAGTTGNRQIAPNPASGKVDGQLLTTAVQGFNVEYAINANDAPLWICEYFIPWDAIPDGSGVLFDKTQTMGFDVDITDRDPGDATRKRALWSNDGTRGVADENWNNMDEAGHVTFEGAVDLVYVDFITLTPGAITTDNGTLQMVANVEPTDATSQKLRWEVTNGTGMAKISSTGLVTAIKNGTVSVKAYALDGGWAESAAVEITITGQVIDNYDVWNSLNKISNWDFNDGITGGWPTGWGGWVDVATAGTELQTNPVVEDGVVSMQCGLASDGANWHYQFNQQPLSCDPNVPYTLKFKSWASADGTPSALDFEDTPALNYVRYGATSDPESPDGRSEWHYTLSTEPTWFTFHVTFDQIQPTSVQKLQFMNSLSMETIYLDSVLLIKDADWTGVAKLQASNTMNVYPNPVGTSNELTVILTSMNARVSIYNALGQKMMEKTANGNMAKFNVASLHKGLYFVRLEDGTSQKFIR